jgi:hypothetical protein
MKALLSGFPAYGRVYFSPERLKEDFLLGRDFSASPQGGPYFSRRDFTENDILKSFDGVILVQDEYLPKLTVIVMREAM